MHVHRRLMLKSLLAVTALAALPRQLLAATRPTTAFESTDLNKAIAGLYKQAATDSDQITLKIPDIAENGAVVPVSVSTELKNVESISLFVDENPTPLAASFELGPRAEPSISLRIKMGSTSQVRALVKADGKLYSTGKEVKVTIGGCGG